MTIENTLSSDGEVLSSLEEEISPHTSNYLDEIKVEEGRGICRMETCRVAMKAVLAAHREGSKTSRIDGLKSLQKRTKDLQTARK